MNSNGQIIADNIRAERNRKDLTQEETAKILGITPRTYITYENDAKNIGAFMLGKLANLFGCNVNSFYIGTNFTKCENVNDLKEITSKEDIKEIEGE